MRIVAQKSVSLQARADIIGVVRVSHLVCCLPLQDALRKEERKKRKEERRQVRTCHAVAVLLYITAFKHHELCHTHTLCWCGVFVRAGKGSSCSSCCGAAVYYCLTNIMNCAMRIHSVGVVCLSVQAKATTAAAVAVLLYITAFKHHELCHTHTLCWCVFRVES